MTLDLRYYLLRFLRRLHYFLIIALPIAALAVLVAYTLPPVYRAEARLLVESPQIPGDMASSTVRTGAAEVLQVIGQRLRTRANLLDLSRRFGLHADQPGLSPDAIVADMRRRIGLRLPGQRDAASFVIVSFEAANPAVSAQVANELVTQILRQNVELRTSAAGQTLEFFEQEVARLDEDLARQGARIIAFKEQNREALPETLAFRTARLSTQQERVLQIERELASLTDRRDRLVTLFERTGAISTPGADAGTPEQRQLRQLRNELTSALVVYSEQNPRVRTLRARIGALEGIVAEQLAVATGGAEGVSPEVTLYEMQLADIDGQIAFATEQRARLEEEITRLEASIEATPSNAIALGTLQRDFENIQNQYNRAADRLAQARTGDRIEAQSRGQRISVLEQATVPTRPASPNRQLIAAAGIVAGAGMGAALVLLLELLDRTARRPADLTRVLGTAPFAALPYMRTRREVVVRRAGLAALVALVTLGVPGALYMVHLNVMPMDMLIARVMERSGLEGLLAQLRQGLS